MSSHEANGVEVKSPDPKRLTLQAAADSFFDGYKHSPKRTLAVHTLTLTGFQRSCEKRYLDQIDERDLLRYVHKLRTDGLCSRTVSNRYLTLRTFLKATGVTRQLPLDSGRASSSRNRRHILSRTSANCLAAAIQTNICSSSSSSRLDSVCRRRCFWSGEI